MKSKNFIFLQKIVLFQDFEDVGGIHCFIERGWNYFSNKPFDNVEISELEIGTDVQ